MDEIIKILIILYLESILDIFCISGLCTSRSEARRLVVQGGAYVNGENIMDIEKIIEIERVKEGAVLLRAGKKRYFRFSID